MSAVGGADDSDRESGLTCRYTGRYVDTISPGVSRGMRLLGSLSPASIKLLGRSKD